MRTHDIAHVLDSVKADTQTELSWVLENLNELELNEIQDEFNEIVEYWEDIFTDDLNLYENDNNLYRKAISFQNGLKHLCEYEWFDYDEFEFNIKNLMKDLDEVR